MATFPTLSTNPISVTETTLSTVHKSVSESKYNMIRKIGTKKMQEWSVIYDESTFLDLADKVLLSDFFDANMGLFFDWLNPDTLVTHVVFFNMEKLDFTSLYTSSGYYTVQLMLTGN